MSSVAVDQAWLATCPKGLEQLLAQELQALGAESTKETVAAVHFDGTRELAYRACLWSRLANRILMPLHSFSLDEEDQLYQECLDIPWEEHFSSRANHRHRLYRHLAPRRQHHVWLTAS